MHRKLAEKRRDDILGEATIAIFKENGEISFESLLNKLKVMMHSERDVKKLEAIKTAAAFITEKLHQLPDKHHSIYDGHANAHYMAERQFKKH